MLIQVSHTWRTTWRGISSILHEITFCKNTPQQYSTQIATMHGKTKSFSFQWKETTLRHFQWRQTTQRLQFPVKANNTKTDVFQWNLKEEVKAVSNHCPLTYHLIFKGAMIFATRITKKQALICSPVTSKTNSWTNKFYSITWTQTE